MKLRASWPVYVVVASAVFALIPTWHVASSFPSTFKLKLLLVALWQAMGAAIAAALVLAGTGFEAVRRRPLTIAHSGAPRAIVATLAGATVVLLLVLATLVASAWLFFGVTVALGVGAIALHQRHLPWRPRTAILAMLGVVTLITGARELDHVGVTWNRSNTHSNRTVHNDSHCDGHNWDGELSVPSLTERYRVQPRLGGNVGRLLEVPAQAALDGTLVMTVVGAVDVGWLGCLVPLRKSVEVETTLAYTAEITQPGARCSVTGTIQLHIDHTLNGFAACRDLREGLADTVREQLVAAARGLAGD